LKDLQTDFPIGFKLAAVIKRHPVEDVLIARKKGMKIKDIKENTIVTTGSLQKKIATVTLTPGY